MKIKAVISVGLQLYKEPRFTFVTARGMKISMRIMPFTIGLKDVSPNRKNARRGKKINLILLT